MSARKQLNTIYAYGILIFAAVMAIIFGSWGLFLIAVPIMLAIALSDGTIRLNPNQQNSGGKGRRRRHR